MLPGKNRRSLFLGIYSVLQSCVTLRFNVVFVVSHIYSVYMYIYPLYYIGSYIQTYIITQTSTHTHTSVTPTAETHKTETKRHFLEGGSDGGLHR